MGDGDRKKTQEVPRRSPPGNEFMGRTVLLVDDDPAQLAHVRDGLSPYGYTFREANNGAQALSAIRENRPDLILMDVEMPGLGGVEVCRIVKANGGEGGFGFIPVILMTARQAAGKVEGLELGADDYLVKPFDMLELGARVKSMLRLKVLQDALVEKNRELDKANKELARKREELLALSRTDALTGLFNRRYFEERMNEEFLRARRYQSHLSLVMLDIDHFKRINDTFGHPFGDEVLKAVAQTARARLREVDLLARYGGEEFIALLPEAAPTDALRACERVREAIENLEVVHPRADGTRQSVRLTASLGLATVPATDLPSAETLLRAADASLYEAKGAGRNRVHQHPGGLT
ncbi:diguanylate cyclase response regulator [Corallococcus sp. H22C18031201]|uniref:diguanylate cyclase n=1 Tax=Citreicoccus inhibens TaxID=2849499 RepID=UPI000E74CA0D|nr:diguanylate cyclase [Citreicoccus inhibens]MBU8895999.1 diguanylate cyclase [Citreicoccus inhibens]RJS25876.1 diguanylate cyclase response regulator [Corallococcus sp. H22C18031201]